jgi:hypothetical protein
VPVSVVPFITYGYSGSTCTCPCSPVYEMPLWPFPCDHPHMAALSHTRNTHNYAHSISLTHTQFAVYESLKRFFHRKKEAMGGQGGGGGGDGGGEGGRRRGGDGWGNEMVEHLAAGRK